jgi:hypothetical protein
MITAERRAKEFCDRFIGLDSNFRRQVEILIKAQDQDTRHACAGGTIQLNRTMSQCPSSDYCKGFNDAVIAAHDLCVNVKAC